MRPGSCIGRDHSVRRDPFSTTGRWVGFDWTIGVPSSFEGVTIMSGRVTMLPKMASRTPAEVHPDERFVVEAAA